MATSEDYCLKIESEIRKKKEVEKSDVACQEVSRHVTLNYVSSGHFRKYSTIFVPGNGYLAKRNSVYDLTEFIRHINRMHSNEIIYCIWRQAK